MTVYWHRRLYSFRFFLHRLHVIGLKTVRMKANVASAASVQSPLLAVSADVLPVWRLDDQVVSVVGLDVSQGAR